MSFWEIVRSGDCPSGKCPSGNRLSGKCLRETGCWGKVRQVNVRQGIVQIANINPKKTSQFRYTDKTHEEIF